MRSWRVAGINFDHLHMGDLLREVHDHPHAEIVGICHSDLNRMAAARKALGIPDDRVFTDLQEQAVTLHTEAGVARPALTGAWFNDGFHGAMAELFSAIEEDREPSNNARDNLPSLALAFAAIDSSRTGVARHVGSVRKLPAAG